MSDMMPGGMPPTARPPMGQPGGRDVMSANRSIMNPIDAAAMKQTGQIRPGMSVEDLLRTWGVTPRDPVEKLVEAIKRQGQNQTGVGKVGAMAQGGAPPMGQTPPRPMPRPQGQPSAAPQAPRQGISELMR